MSWGAVTGPAPQTPGASAGVNPAYAWLGELNRPAPQWPGFAHPRRAGFRGFGVSS